MKMPTNRIFDICSFFLIHLLISSMMHPVDGALASHKMGNVNAEEAAEKFSKLSVKTPEQMAKVRELHENLYYGALKALLGQLGKQLYEKLAEGERRKLAKCLDRVENRFDLVATARCLVDSRHRHLDWERLREEADREQAEEAAKNGRRTVAFAQETEEKPATTETAAKSMDREFVGHVALARLLKAKQPKKDPYLLFDQPLDIVETVPVLPKLLGRIESQRLEKFRRKSNTKVKGRGKAEPFLKQHRSMEHNNKLKSRILLAKNNNIISNRSSSNRLAKYQATGSNGGWKRRRRIRREVEEETVDGKKMMMMAAGGDGMIDIVEQMRKMRQQLKQDGQEERTKEETTKFKIRSAKVVSPIASRDQKSLGSRISNLLLKAVGPKAEKANARWTKAQHTLERLAEQIDRSKKFPGTRVFDKRMYDLVLDRDEPSMGPTERRSPLALLQQGLKMVEMLPGRRGAQTNNNTNNNNDNNNGLSNGNNVRMFSPRFMPLAPDKGGPTNPKSVMSPTLLALYEETDNQSLANVPTMLREAGVSEKDRQGIIGTLMEMTGTTSHVENALSVLQEVNFFDEGVGKPLMKATDRLLNAFFNLEDSLDGHQRKQCTERGFTFAKKGQLMRLLKDQALDSEQLIPAEELTRFEHYDRMSAEEKEHALWATVEQLAGGEHRRVKRTFPVNIFKPIILSPFQFAPTFGLTLFGPVILSPSTFSPYVLAPSLFSPLILAPPIFSPLVLSPSVASPWILTPGVANPYIISPYIFGPFILGPLVLHPFVLSPYAISPNILNPYVLSPIVLNPIVLSPDILSPQVLGGAVFSPAMLSPAILTQTFLMVSIFSPTFLS